jgi:translation initiation factor IF-3
MNERIRAREVRVIDDEGAQLGIMPPFEALKIARGKGLDLVEISPNAVPPVCKIQDFGKFLYEQEKRERAAKKKQKVITVKEVKFSVNVDEHDYEFKKNNVIRFLAEGDKVKASLRFRGREMAHQSLGRGVLDRLISDVGEHAVVEFRPRMEGNTMHAILAPKKAEPVKAAKPPRPPQAPPQSPAAPA